MLSNYPVSIGSVFKIRFIHSIHLTPVEEFYSVSEDMNIVLNELHFDTYSVGMPSELNEGEQIELKDGKIIIKNMRRVFPYIDLRVGQVIANHSLTINEQTIKLSDITPPGTWVRIQINKLSILELFWGRLIK
ncbi:DUF1850 domain-containing protein [Vulcanibacillus modesticaldus]|nr:DUF1850 domain-containing protein [Vulcanibacillus modesticaldus]